MKRQGELLIIKLDRLDMSINDAKRELKRSKRRILAEGEVTGHMHELNTGKVFKSQRGIWQEKSDTQYFNVKRGMVATLTHPEHKSLTFEEGIYKVITQREYTEKGIQRVRD